MRPLIIFLLLIQSAWAAWSYSGTSGDFAYSATYDQTPGGAYEGTASITGYTGSASSVVIPESVNFTASHGGQNVTVNCAVTKIQYGNGQPGVFQDKTSITSVSIPSSLQSIERFSFSGCSGLISVTIPSGVTLIGDDAFGGCSALATLTLNEGLESIGTTAFRGCHLLQSVSIPASLKYTGSTFHQGYRGGPFEECSGLTSITVACGADIGIAAFQNCPNLLNLAFFGTIDPANPGSVGTRAFGGCSKLTNFTIPIGTSLGDAAFYRCTSLTSMTIPAGITSIPIALFSGCSNLTSIDIPAGVTTIGANAFYDCAKLVSVSIPSGVTEIGYEAFRACVELQILTLPTSVTKIKNQAFLGCSKLEELSIPTGVTLIEHGAFAGTGIKSIAIPPGVTIIENNVFFGCVNLTNVTIPDSVTTIGYYAFYYCPKLAILKIPSTVTAIGKEAFRDCSALSGVFFTGGAPAMGQTVFLSCPVTCYYLHGASGFTSPTWQGYPCFIAAPYGGILPNSSTNEAHLIGGVPTDGNVRLEASVTDAPLLWQRQATPVTLDMESSRILRLGATGTVRIEAGDGALDIGRSVGDGFLTAGGAANTPGTLVLDNASSNDITVHADISNNGSGVVGLNKTSSGRAVLVGMNTYSGNTAIFGGTLVLKSPCLADASAVTISSGSTLNLDYAGADIVSSLTISGTAKPNGLYDSTNTSGRITGTGKIQVGPFANFAAWSSAIAPGQTGNQDHDNDGVPNGVEYFMGKAGNDFTPNPGIAPDGTVTWPKGASFVGTYQIQTSTNLSNWTDVTNDPAQVAINPTSVIWTRPAAIGNLFVRLVISPN